MSTARRWLLAAVAAHLVAATAIAANVPDRLSGVAEPGPFDPEAYLLIGVPAVPALLALAATGLPRAARPTALALAGLGLLVALLLVPAFGLGVLLLPGAVLAVVGAAQVPQNVR